METGRYVARQIGRGVQLLLFLLVVAAPRAQAQEILANFAPVSNPYAGLISGADGYLYGTTAYGGEHGRGSVYRIDPSSGLLTTVVSFNGPNGSNPYSPLLLSSGQLYGTTYAGGSADYGTIFRIELSSGSLTTLFSFQDWTGENPRGGMLLIGDSLYGTTAYGGAGWGTVFRFDLTTGTMTHLAEFQNSDGASPYGTLLQRGGALFGTTSSAGANNGGTIFKIDLASGRLTTLAHLSNSTGMNSYAGLVDGGSFLYGTAYNGGSNSRGTIFKVDPLSGATTAIVSLSDATVGRPRASLACDGAFLYGTGTVGGANARGAIFKVDLEGTAVTNLASFPTATTVANPYATPILVGSDVIVTTLGCGANGTGSIMRVSTGGGTLDTLYSFPASGGNAPYEVVINGSYLYGFTTSGGNDGLGFLYKINLSTGAVTRLASLTTGSASRCGAPLIYNGALYGTTNSAIYRLDLTTEAFSIVASFPSGSLTGSIAYAGLVEYGGYLYGTTYSGGSSGKGTIYRFDPATNSATTVANLASIGGQSSYSHLTVSGTCLYGVTYNGGAYGSGLLFRFDPSDSSLTALASFGGDLDLRLPYSGLTASGSRLYGTTLGTSKIYSYDLTSGALTTIATFVASTTGAQLYGGVVVDGNNLYGAAYFSGPTGRGLNGGTVYAVDATTGAAATVLASFDGSNGQNPFGTVVLSGNALYGATVSGGSLGGGVVYRVPLGRASTTTSLASSPNPSSFAQSVTFTATVSAGATGHVWFFDESSYLPLGSAMVDSGQASLATAALSGGMHSVFAWYGGDAAHVGSISAPISHVVENANATFTDDPLVAGTTPVKAIHLTEVRAAIDALRSALGLAPVTWSDSDPRGLPVAASHIAALRDALTPALGLIGRIPSFHDQIAAGATVRAVHLQELRQLLK